MSARPPGVEERGGAFTGLAALARASASHAPADVDRRADAALDTEPFGRRGFAGEASDESLAHPEPHRRAAPARLHGWTNGAALLATAGRVLLWIAIACGPVAMIATALAPHVGDAEVAQPTTASASETRAAEALAVSVVGAWLSATAEQPEPLLTLLPGTVVEATHATPYRDLVVAGVTPVDAAGVVGVVVGALIDESMPEQPPVDDGAPGDGSTGDEAAGAADTQAPGGPAWVPRYFQVAVSTYGGVSALAEPAAVAPPAPADPISDATVPIDHGSDVAGAVELFLSAYLTSSADLDRFTAPEAGIPPLPGAPYVAVTARTLTASEPPSTQHTAGDELTVRASVSAITRTETTHTLTYWLTLTARDGRWEVAAISPGPVGAPSEAAT